MDELTNDDIRAYVILTTPAEYAVYEAAVSALVLEADRAEAA